MDFALAPVALLPGVFSYALACAPRSRAIAPRDLTATLAATLAFTVINFVLAGLLLKGMLTAFCHGAPSLNAMAAALLLGEGRETDTPTRREVVSALFSINWRNILGVFCLVVTCTSTGLLGGWLGQRSLRALALRHLGQDHDRRGRPGRWFDASMAWLGVQALFLPRGASCWLLVREKAKLLSKPSRKELDVYADITQGDDSVLFAGQVHQVIASTAGETLSIVLFKARRYRRSWKPSTPPLEGATGTRSLTHQSQPDDGPWKTIGQSEAFYMRGDCINNISYRVYGDPAQAAYSVREGWNVPDQVLQLAKAILAEADSTKTQQPGN